MRRIDISQYPLRPATPNPGAAIVAWNGRMWVASGPLGYGPILSSIGYSYDGIHWTGARGNKYIYRVGGRNAVHCRMEWTNVGGGGGGPCPPSIFRLLIVMMASIGTAVSRPSHQAPHQAPRRGSHGNGRMWVAVGRGAATGTLLEVAQSLIVMMASIGR